MNVAVQPRAGAVHDAAWLTPALRALSAEALLDHFRTRTTPSLFVVEDVVETTPEKIAGVMIGDFTFNQERYSLGKTFDWRENPSRDAEWHILLHKFYYAVGLARTWKQTGDNAFARRALDLIASWIGSGVPEGFIAADVTGRRLQNWVYAWTILLHAKAFTPALQCAFLRSVHAQTSWLRHNLHAKRNHRTLELYAIFLVSTAFPELADATEWRCFSLEALTANAQADFQPDGVHCEQSTHYHCIALRNFLHVVRLARLNRIELDDALIDVLRRALHFAAAIHRPDGEIPAASDADGGSYLDMIGEGAFLLDCFLPPQGSIHFPDSGYVVLRTPSPSGGDAHFLLLDAGPLGDGNHGHLDALSVEIHSFGKALIVDPGRYTYDETGAVNWRVAFRGTAAHSTVQVDGLDQARYASGERKWKIKGPLAQSRVLAFHTGGAVEHAHAEVLSAEYAAKHQRHIFLVNACYWLVLDLLTSPEQHSYSLRYQLASSFAHAPLVTRSKACVLAAQDAAIHIAASATGAGHIEQGWISRLYGQRTPAPRLCFTTRGNDIALATLIAPPQSSLALGPLTFADGRATIAVHDGATAERHDLDVNLTGACRLTRNLADSREELLAVGPC